MDSQSVFCNLQQMSKRKIGLFRVNIPGEMCFHITVLESTHRCDRRLMTKTVKSAAYIGSRPVALYSRANMEAHRGAIPYYDDHHYHRKMQTQLVPLPLLLLSFLETTRDNVRGRNLRTPFSI